MEYQVPKNKPCLTSALLFQRRCFHAKLYENNIFQPFMLYSSFSCLIIFKYYQSVLFLDFKNIKIVST